MTACTLGFLFKNDKIILAKKKRKIGAGKWNGYGGKIEENEDRLGCLMREIKGECGITVEKGQCKELGYVDFSFEENEELNQKVYIYRIDGFSGEPKESEEMGNPKEFNINEIPYDEMMVGDDKFMPFVIKSKKVNGEMLFSKDGKTLIKCILVEVANEIRMK